MANFPPDWFADGASGEDVLGEGVFGLGTSFGAASEEDPDAGAAVPSGAAPASSILTPNLLT